MLGLPVSYDVPYLCRAYGEFKGGNVILQTNKEDHCHKIPFIEWLYAIPNLRIVFYIIRLTELLVTDQQRHSET